MGKNEVVLLFLLSFSHLSASTAPKLRWCCYCSSPCGCLEALTWKSGWQLSVLRIQREAQGSAKQDACRIYLLQSALPSRLHNPPMQWAKRHLALLWNSDGSRKTGFNARSNQRERAIEPSRELPMPVSLEDMSTRMAGKGLHRLGLPLDRQWVPQKPFAGFISRILLQALSQHSVPEPFWPELPLPFCVEGGQSWLLHRWGWQSRGTPEPFTWPATLHFVPLLPGTSRCGTAV